MNWTGGSLQRTKNANKGVVQKQKAYFARVRTHLQNGSRSPIAPFRPSYLQNIDSFELAGHLPSYGLGGVRHTGHSARHRRGSTQHELSPGKHTLQSGNFLRPIPKEASPEPLRGGASGVRHTCALADEQRGKRKVDDADLETQLLEANRKRLTGQHDWIGVAPSKPLNLHFQSNKEKSKVGRRRKIEGKYGATARYREPVDFLTQGLRPTEDQHAGAFVSGAVRNHPNDIRIRFGTDALTTACSTEPNDYSQSHASSDPMLFDQQVQDTEQPDVLKAAQSIDRTFLQNNHTADHEGTWTDQRAQFPSPPCRLEAGHSRQNLDSCSPDEAISSFTKSFPVSKVLASEDTVLGFRIAQQIEGVQYPLRLTFGGSNSSTDARSHITVHDRGSGGTNYDYAGDSQIGSLHHLGTEPELQSESEAAAAVAIVDEKPWNSFLDVPDKSSSHTTSPNESERSIMHQNPTAQNFEAERTSWSQHATQGEQTHASSSVISPSLPSLRRGVQMRASAYATGTGVDHWNKTTSRILDEDERLWQNFVFDSGEEACSEAMHERWKSSEQRTWKGSSEYLPLSVAVSSVSFTPFRPISGRASRMRDSVHDAARSAPRSGSRMISSPAAMPAGFIEGQSAGELGEDAAEPSAFGEQSVTHVSLLNNASCDAANISSRMFSHTQTSRSDLDPIHCRTGSLLECAQGNSSETVRQLRRSSVHDILESDDDGLDLVDADKSS